MSTGQVKKYQRSKGYESLPRELLQDENLSLEAIGLLSYMQSLPETWVLYKTQLYTQFPKNKRSSIDRIWKELVENKYLLNFRKREGKKYVYNYIFSVLPFSEEDIQDILKEQNDNDFWSVDFQQSKMDSSKSTTNKLTIKKSNIKRLDNSKEIKNDDDEYNINEAQNNLEKLVELTNSSEELKFLSQGLFESKVDLDEIVLIAEYFNRTGNFKIDVVKQQLEWMKQKSETETGISDFGVYFIQGYEKRIKSNKFKPIQDLESQFYEKMGITEELPNIPMYNWLNNN